MSSTEIRSDRRLNKLAAPAEKPISYGTGRVQKVDRYAIDHLAAEARRGKKAKEAAKQPETGR